MFTTNSYNPDSQPLGHFKGYPVYLATVLVAVHVLSAAVNLFYGDRWQSNLLFFPALAENEPWRWLTYAYAERVSIWFVMSMFFMFFIGKRLEIACGRRFFGLMYLALILTGSLVAFLMNAVGKGELGVLGGSTFITFALFFGSCLLEPEVPFFGVEWMTAKWVGLVSLGIGLLGHLASGETTMALILLSSVLVAYFFLRRAGMPDHLAVVKAAFMDALPKNTKQQRTKPVAYDNKSVVKKESSPSKYYEPKIKPKPDLAPERKAVEEVDAILDKIARSGMDSLTDAEKAALQNASTRLKDTDY